MSAPFSLLMAVYAGDRPEPFRRALASVTGEQTRPPAQVVLVQDGPLGPALRAAVERAVADCPVPIELVRLDHNEGLAAALTAGLARCEHEIVARADADDLCLPGRFEVQVPMVEGGLDLVGAAMEEFEREDDGPGDVRSRPADAAAIRAYAARHNPFNHPTVVFRRSAVDAVGGYQELPLMEDYWLWARMIMAGAPVANSPEVLVRYRVTKELYDRRGGLRALRSDWDFQRRALALGLTGRPRFALNLLERVAYRAVPGPVRRWASRTLVQRAG